MIACYVLLSPKLNKYYIGVTQEGLDLRLEKHNAGFYKDSYTKITQDWELYYFIECVSISQAMKIEKHIKKMKSKLFIENLIRYPEISQKLLKKYF